jgi:aspartate kinase
LNQLNHNEEITVKTQLSIAKFGGSLLDIEGKGIPKILKSIRELKTADSTGPIAVFSAPTGCTDELIRIGETCAQANHSSVNSIFQIYENLAEQFVKGDLAGRARRELAFYRKHTEDALGRVNRRFSGNIKAKVLTYGGELATAALMNCILQSNGIESANLPTADWPIVTDDDFEDATPNYPSSLKRIDAFIKPLQAGKAVCMAGFFGVTSDGLETILGRGGSDLSAVFASCLLKDEFETKTLLYKDVPVQSADPKVVKGQKTQHVAVLTYNEAHKASMMGMKIVQSSAIALARSFSLPLRVVPINDPENYSTIQAENTSTQIVKCLTGKTDCAILTMHDENSRSLEDSLRIWERRNDFMDLGAETLETGERIRDFLFLDSDYLQKNEEKLKGFDEELKVEYGLGVVTLIGDRMKDSHGVASTAISSIQGLNIKRGIFAPHTSQIIIVVEEKNVKAAVAGIHLKMAELNKPPA